MRQTHDGGQSVKLLLALFIATTLQAAIEGVVINRTLGRPESKVMVTLYRASPGAMNPVASVVSGPDGSFRFEQAVTGPHLLQAIYAGVVYNQMLPQQPSSGRVEVAVYEPTTDPKIVQLTQHFLLLEPIESALHVSETVLVNNPANRVLVGSHNPVRFYVPGERRGEPRLSIVGPQGVPVDRPLIPTNRKNVYTVDFPLRPGETRLDLSYVVELGPERSFTVRNVQEAGVPLRVIAPLGVTLHSDRLEAIAQEPQTLATVYELRGREARVTIQGSGSLRLASESESRGPGLQEKPPRLYRRLAALLALMSAMLALAFVWVFRRGLHASQLPATQKSSR